MWRRVPTPLLVAACDNAVGPHAYQVARDPQVLREKECRRRDVNLLRCVADLCKNVPIWLRDHPRVSMALHLHATIPCGRCPRGAQCATSVQKCRGQMVEGIFAHTVTEALRERRNESATGTLCSEGRESHERRPGTIVNGIRTVSRSWVRDAKKFKQNGAKEIASKKNQAHWRYRPLKIRTVFSPRPAAARPTTCAWGRARHRRAGSVQRGLSAAQNGSFLAELLSSAVWHTSGIYPCSRRSAPPQQSRVMLYTRDASRQYSTLGKSAHFRAPKILILHWKLFARSPRARAQSMRWVSR